MKIRGFEKVSIDEMKLHAPNVAYDNIKLPERATEYSAGYDFYSPIKITLRPNHVYMIPTGIKAYMDIDEVLQIYIRSSMAIKHGIKLSNSVGIIDSDYYNNIDNEGHIFICLENTTHESYRINIGDKIAQGIFVRYWLTDNDKYYNSDKLISSIRTGGIGSTGE